jgi:hypothetical protein
MAKESNSEPTQGGGTRSTVVRAAVAAAATGAAAYGVRRLRSSHQEDGDAEAAAADDHPDEDGEDDGDTGKREELTRALSAKVSDAKNAASRLKPGGNGRSMVDTAWEAASEQLRPVAGEAAASLGATVAKKAPGVVRDELMPRFIEGFENAS